MSLTVPHDPYALGHSLTVLMTGNIREGVSGFSNR